MAANEYYVNVKRLVLAGSQNRWVRRFRAAQSGVVAPSSERLIPVEGGKLLEDSLAAGLTPVAFLVSVSGERYFQRLGTISALRYTDVPVVRVTNALFAAISGTESPQGIACLFTAPNWSFDDLLRGGPSRLDTNTARFATVVVLSEIQDPGNVGTILRSAEAFGATGVVATRGTADPWSPKAIRASAGSALRLPLLRGMAIPALIAQLRLHQIKIYSTGAGRSKGAVDIESVPRSPSAIFIGNEGAGLPAEVLNAADGILSIPLASTVESLNAGVAASILLYEISRIRRKAQ